MKCLKLRLMKIRELIVVVALVLVANVAVGQESSDVWLQFAQELRASNDSLQTIRCSFTQTRSMAMLVNDVKKSGKFYYKQPGRTLLAYDDGDFIRMTPAMFEMSTAGRLTRIKVSANPMMGEMNRILAACIAGDVDQITAGFDVTLTRNSAECVVCLTPQSKRAASRMAKMELAFDLNDMSLARLKMVEPSGDYTQYNFYDKKFNATVDDSLFEIER